MAAVASCLADTSAITGQPAQWVVPPQHSSLSRAHPVALLPLKAFRL
jgi:hypothetical protein